MKKTYVSLDKKKKKKKKKGTKEKGTEIKRSRSEVIGLHATEVQKNKNKKQNKNIIHLPLCPAC